MTNPSSFKLNWKLQHPRLQNSSLLLDDPESFSDQNQVGRPRRLMGPMTSSSPVGEILLGCLSGDGDYHCSCLQEELARLAARGVGKHRTALRAIRSSHVLCHMQHRSLLKTKIDGNHGTESCHLDLSWHAIVELRHPLHLAPSLPSQDEGH